MQSASPISVLFRHHLWANIRLLEQCAKLNDEQLDASIPGSFGTIRDTLQHIVRSDQSYFSRISTGQPWRFPENAPALTFPEMLESVQRSGTGLIEWVSQVQADDMVQINWDGIIYDVPKTIVLTQAINHATEHRAQIMTIMTHLGVQPLDVDGWTYFDESKQ